MKYTLYREGSFYKGNLHVHTTVSDGDHTPEETKKIYKDKGYDFLSITDHNIYGIYEELNDPDFLMIPGIEIDSYPGECTHHVVGISTPERTLMPHGYQFDKPKYMHLSPQGLVDFLATKNNRAIYAHPAWSYANLYEFSDLTNLLGVEIMNYSCEQESKRGNGEVYYEQLRNKAKNTWCFGSDDAHGHVPDYCGAYISVKASSFTHEGIFRAIQDGSFTASYLNYGDQAPEVYDFYVEDGVAKIWTSPCKSIHVNGSRAYYFPTLSEQGQTLTYTEVKLPASMEYVCAICTDIHGNMTWTQPISL